MPALRTDKFTGRKWEEKYSHCTFNPKNKHKFIDRKQNQSYTSRSRKTHVHNYLKETKTINRMRMSHVLIHSILKKASSDLCCLLPGVNRLFFSLDGGTEWRRLLISFHFQTARQICREEEEEEEGDRGEQVLPDECLFIFN